MENEYFEDVEDDGWDQVDDSEDTFQNPSEHSQNQESVHEENVQIYNQAQILDISLKRIELANETLQMNDKDAVVAIMRHFDWDIERMQQGWFENQAEFELEIGLTYDSSLVLKNKNINESRLSSSCTICYCEYEPNDEDYKPLHLVCGHTFHRACWQEYLKEAVKTDPKSVFLKCMQQGCNVVVPHSFFIANLTDEEQKGDSIKYRKKYMQWHCKQFTEENRNLQWCPKKGCDNIVFKSDWAPQSIVNCSCGYGFCFKCLEEDHAPGTCNQVKEWIKKERAESENMTWMKAFTKPCPKCSSSIEKNQGCNHMTCFKCKHQFCWLCLADDIQYKHTQGGQSCDQKESDRVKNLEKVQNASKVVVQRYMFNFERYNNENNSRKLCKQKMIQIEDTMGLLHEVKKYPAEELQFFKDCGSVILKCRQVLKWTYVVNFYSQQNLMQEGLYELFLFQQQALHQICEQTHELLDKDMGIFLDEDHIDRTPFYRYRAETINKMQLLQKQYESFIELINNDDRFQV